MAYVFVSHASEDKIVRVKPLVEALVILGVRLWIDRPGYGDSHFNFDQDYIERHGILGLQSGETWNQQVESAIRDAGAVLVCLSRALDVKRGVLVHELLLGAHHRKLVACIVDDLPFTDLPANLGLADASKIQAERIDPATLRQAVDVLRRPGTTAEQLPAPQLKQWEIVRKLVADIERILDRAGPRLPSAEALNAACDALQRYPIGPIVMFQDIPLEIIRLFAARFDEPDKAGAFLVQAMQLRARCNSEGFEDRQVLIAAGEVLNPSRVSAEEYWADVLSSAGRKSRRTLAAFLVAPGAPDPETLQPSLGESLKNFKAWLERPRG